MSAVVRITLCGRQHGVTLPGQIERMELVDAWGTAQRAGLFRAAAAMVGLCTRIGRASRVDYAAHGCNAMAYGGAVYNWLAKAPQAPVEGVEPVCPGKLTDAELIAAGQAIYALLAEALYPTQAEVDAKADFTEAGEAAPS